MTLKYKKHFIFFIIVFCHISDKVFKNGPSKICGMQSLRNLTWVILKYFVSFIGDGSAHQIC